MKTNTEWVLSSQLANPGKGLAFEEVLRRIRQMDYLLYPSEDGSASEGHDFQHSFILRTKIIKQVREIFIQGFRKKRGPACAQRVSMALAPGRKTCQRIISISA